MKQTFVFFLFMLANPFVCLASNDSIASLANTVNKFNKVFPQEKVYLHLDNTGYFKDEKIWFKAYVTRTDNDSLASISKVLYVELINPYGDIEQSVKLPIKDGQAHGNIELADLLNSGYYEIRAYTRYMLNWGTDAIFSRVVPVFESPGKAGDYSNPIMTTRIPDRLQPVKRVSTETGNKKLNVGFYPEGGKMVAGLSGRVAFYITDRDGRGLAATCGLEKDGVPVGTSVETNADGRGVIETGKDNAGLSLSVRTQDGNRKTVQLPSPVVSGCSLMADMTSTDSIIISLASTPDLRGREVGIVWLNGGHLYDCTEAALSERALRLSYGRDSRRGGVNQIAVIDSQGEILASRMVFVYPHDDMYGIAFTVRDSIIGKKIRLMADGTPNTTFSLSVTDAEAQTGGWNESIASWYLLTSDIKGYVRNPQYYLESDDAEHRMNADLLMLVQGWKRYDLKMMEGKANFHFKSPIEKSLQIDGKLKERSRKNKVDFVDLSVMLLNNSGDRLYGQTKTDSKGNFAFALPDCYRCWTMIMMTAKDSKFKNYYVGINRHFSPTLRTVSPFELEPLELNAPSFSISRLTEISDRKTMDDVFTLQEVDVVGKKWASARKAWESEERGAYEAVIKYDCEKDADNIIDRGEDVPSLIDYLKEKNPLFLGNDNLSGTYGKNNMLDAFYNDGLSYDRRPIVWIVNNSFLGGTSFPTRMNRKGSKVADGSLDDSNTVYFPVSLDEVKRVYISFSKNNWRRFMPALDMGGDNIVTVLVYTTENAGSKQSKGVRVTYFDGFNLASSYEEDMLTGIAPDRDYRRTLYWNPNVRTDGRGKASVEFVNNSRCTMFHISAEGMTDDGKVCKNK